MSATSPASSLPRQFDPAHTEIRGTAASQGCVTGRARILNRPEDGLRMQPGDILVCAVATPAWTPRFSMAAGIVTETGGALSAPATIARELGTPAVFAVNNATTRIRDGQTITVDGARGLITLQA